MLCLGPRLTREALENGDWTLTGYGRPLRPRAHKPKARTLINLELGAHPQLILQGRQGKRGSRSSCSDAHHRLGPRYEKPRRRCDWADEPTKGCVLDGIGGMHQGNAWECAMNGSSVGRYGAHVR
jgi:hypothetical protein